MTYTNIDEIKDNYDVTLYQESPIVIPEKPESGLILLVGSSGSGKSTILKKWFGTNSEVLFDNTKSVVENFTTLDNGVSLLQSFGLRSIPTWFRTYNTLSNGESHRAYCAKSIDNGNKYIDEFTSVVDRDTAKSLSWTLKKAHKEGELLVVASCHRDITEWLCPDMIYDTDACRWVDRGCLRRPEINLTIKASSIQDWVLFKKHHYLSGELANACHCYTACIGDKPVAFLGIIHRTGRDIKSYWGESRLVVLPEFQGLGIGKTMSETIGQEYLDRGFRYFSKTSHPILGNYRNSSTKWRAL